MYSPLLLCIWNLPNNIIWSSRFFTRFFFHSKCIKTCTLYTVRYFTCILHCFSLFLLRHSCSFDLPLSAVTYSACGRWRAFKSSARCARAPGYQCRWRERRLPRAVAADRRSAGGERGAQSPRSGTPWRVR